MEEWETEWSRNRSLLEKGNGDKYVGEFKEREISWSRSTLY